MKLVKTGVPLCLVIMMAACSKNSTDWRDFLENATIEIKHSNGKVPVHLVGNLSAGRDTLVMYGFCTEGCAWKFVKKARYNEVYK